MGKCCRVYVVGVMSPQRKTPRLFYDLMVYFSLPTKLPFSFGWFSAMRNVRNLGGISDIMASTYRSFTQVFVRLIFIVGVLLSFWQENCITSAIVVNFGGSL